MIGVCQKKSPSGVAASGPCTIARSKCIQAWNDTKYKYLSSTNLAPELWRLTADSTCSSSYSFAFSFYYCFITPSPTPLPSSSTPSNPVLLSFSFISYPLNLLFLIIFFFLFLLVFLLIFSPPVSPLILLPLILLPSQSSQTVSKRSTNSEQTRFKRRSCMGLKSTTLKSRLNNVQSQGVI